MTGPSYRDRDHAFGQSMLTLRTAIGLTQAGLAEVLHVTRHAVGQWEAGGSYPKADHLKRFIALAVEHRAFSSGHEAEEIRAFWQSARQKTPIDDSWLSALLAAPASGANQAARETFTAAWPEGATPQTGANEAAKVRRPRLDWGDALAVPHFYGREWELNLLEEWVVGERCRVVSVLGLGGIGKSALAVSLMHRVAMQFDVVIWRSLRDLPTCEVLLEDLLQVLAPHALTESHASLEHRQGLLLDCMRSNRILFVLDNVESVLEEGEGAGRMRPGYEGFGRFLRQCAATEHQSCVVLTSREKPSDLVPQEGNQSPVRALRIARLDAAACEQLLTEKGITGTAADRAKLIESYAGNPLALKIVSQTIADLFGGAIAPFLEQGEIIFGGVRELLAEQFARVSALEQCVLMWLAIMREPATLDELLVVLFTPVSRARLLEALEALHRRSLLERGQRQGAFTLQSVVLEYMTTRLIAEASAEIAAGKLARLLEHGLELAQAREHVRQTQERLLVAPVLSQLRGAYPQSSALEKRLRTILSQMAAWSDDAQGYGPANLVTLLRLHCGHLRGLELSRLALRGLHLRGVEMQDVSMAGATIRDSVFTESFDVMTAIAINSTDDYWAAASRRGEILVWDAGGLTLHRMWRAHADMIWTLAFSPDGRMLASGSWDGAVKLWDVLSGALIWSGRHTSHANRVAFAPDGSVLASSGNDATVRLWDVRTGTQLQVLPHSAPVPAVAWSAVTSDGTGGQLFASGDLEGTIQLWETCGAESATCLETFAGHTTWVDGLAFAPDGRTLASASWDGTVKLWDISVGSALSEAQGRNAGEDNRYPLATLTGHTDRALRVSWSPDGRILASSSRDKTIWLWDIEQRRYRAALRGHSAGVNGVGYTSDSRTVVSASEDGTMRAWDIASGQCLRVVQGYAASLYDFDWSPDGSSVVSGGTDYLVTIYSVTGEALPRVLRGHIGVVFGVGWRPDGQCLASSEWDNIIRLWDPVSGECIKVLHHPDDAGNYFYGLAWSPDGQRLACGTYRRGIHIFEMAAQQRWVGQPFPTWIRHVAWSPDGTQLAGGGDDGAVYVWDAVNGALLQRLAGHHGMITRMAWSSDGMRLASGSRGIESGELFVWDAQRGERIHTFAGHSGIVSGVAWNANDELLISGGDDGKLRWWDVQLGACVRVSDAHFGTVQAIRRSPDGTKLASCGDDGAIMLWDSANGEHLKKLRRDRPYERLNITGIKGLTEAQKATLHTLGAFEDVA